MQTSILAVALGIAVCAAPKSKSVDPNDEIFGPVRFDFRDESQTNPLGRIKQDMTKVVAKLETKTTGAPTQKTQREIVERLDDLIAQLEKECENCKGSRVKKNPTKPAKDSTVRNGPGGSGDLHSPKPHGKQWGELPPRERDRILQAMTEGFPPHYQQVLERYYRRLAEEKPAGDADTAAESATTDKKASGDQPGAGK